MNEYQELLKIIESFDSRLLIIKGWAISFSLATLVVAIEKQKKAIILVVIMSSICFWILEGETKFHQTKYYSRMRAIEIINTGLIKDGKKVNYVSNSIITSSPLIDWTWENPREALTNEISERKEPSRLCVYFYPHVIFPHFLIILSSLVLWYLNRSRFN